MKKKTKLLMGDMDPEEKTEAEQGPGAWPLKGGRRSPPPTQGRRREGGGETQERERKLREDRSSLFPVLEP